MPEKVIARNGICVRFFAFILTLPFPVEPRLLQSRRFPFKNKPDFSKKYTEYILDISYRDAVSRFLEANDTGNK